jgi:hypothetical protein
MLARTSDVDTSSALNVKVKAAPTSWQLSEQPETTQVAPRSDESHETDPDAAVRMKHWPHSTLGMSYNQSEVMLNEQPGHIVPKIDPTTATLQAALRILSGEPRWVHYEGCHVEGDDGDA